jgi:hypothetical protein
MNATAAVRPKNDMAVRYHALELARRWIEARKQAMTPVDSEWAGSPA